MTLAWAPLDYLIGYDGIDYGAPGRILEVGYDQDELPRTGTASIAYCNLFDEKNTGAFGPYLHESDTADEYDEGQIDPDGPGWHKNLVRQFERRRESGFKFVELDNPDAYDWDAVRGAIDLAADYGLTVIAKNAKLTEQPVLYLGHHNIAGCIVEFGAGTPQDYDALRKAAGKPDLPVWFVFFGKALQRARATADAIKEHRLYSMSVTYSAVGEYGSSKDIV